MSMETIIALLIIVTLTIDDGPDAITPISNTIITVKRKTVRKTLTRHMPPTSHASDVTTEI